MEMTIDDQIVDVVERINLEGTYKVSLDWAFDSNAEDGMSDTYGIITLRLPGKNHACEITADTKEVLYAHLQTIYLLTGLESFD